jgi:hypothetical protein
MNVSILLVIFSFVMVSGMFLVLVIIEVLLSRLKSAWPGLILPIVFFLLGFSIVLGIPASMISGLGLMIFLLPVTILTVIYFIMRRIRKIPSGNELRKMRAQDL